MPFYNFKTILQNNNGDFKVNENSLKDKIIFLCENKPQGKMVFEKICKKDIV